VTTPPSPPRGSIAERYNAFLFDLDGVLYRGDQPVPNGREAVRGLRQWGKRIIFMTNNSSRTPTGVADRLRGQGVDASPDEVITSALATASLLAHDSAGGGRGSSSGATAFVIGEIGIRTALADAGILVLDGEPDRADFVVVGVDTAATYADLRTASLLVQRGAKLVATNADASFPAPDGLWPGAGALLAAVTTTVGREADLVAGKPHRPLYDAAQEAAGSGRPLAVGDRIDTDIAGASAAGLDSLLVFTGVSVPSDLLRTNTLPTFVGRTLHALKLPAADIRLATPSDTAAVAGLLRKAGLDDAGAAQRVPDTLVAVEGSDVVGSVAIEMFDPPQEPGRTAAFTRTAPYAHLRSLAVIESRRGRYLGALLVARAVQMARDRGADEVFCVTDTADRYFIDLGFRPIGTKDELPEPLRSTDLVARRCSSSATALLLPGTPERDRQPGAHPTGRPSAAARTGRHSSPR
jgi:glycerol-1-phosphatase